MKIYVSVKQIGKRKEYLTKKELILLEVPLTLRELLTQIVHLNVKSYNLKTPEPLLIQYLTDQQIEGQAYIGKVGFFDRKNVKLADSNKALETAIQAFEDGIYRVFLQNIEIPGLDEPIKLTDGNVLTFIRFTMLAGRRW